MTIGITGASGFLGGEMMRQAIDAGERVVAFSRNPDRKLPGAAEVRGFDLVGVPDFEGCDAVVHLAAESVVGLWTEKKMWAILESRVQGTRAVVNGMLKAQQRPKVLVCASGVGFYGDTGESCVDEGASLGRGFLSDVAEAWEAEATRAESVGIRVVRLRIAMVLGRGGGALAAMLPIFRLGLGGKLGTGRQWMSWVHLHDVAALALAAVRDEGFNGAVNACAPEPVRNAEFTMALGRAVNRPAIFWVPAFALRLALRGFSAELLENRRVLPAKALDCGFTFAYPTLAKALDASN